MRERGFTTVELMSALVLGTAILLMIGQSLATVGKSHGFQRDRMRVADISDRVLRSIQRDVGFAAHVFADGTPAEEYRAALAIPRRSLQATVALPLATARGYFDVDPPGSRQTGNLLLLARSREAISIVPEDEEENPLRIDTFEFVAYYATENENADVDLARWVSAPLASATDLQGIENTWERRRVLTKLHDAGVRFAWSPGEPRSEGLFEIRSGGRLVPLRERSTIPAAPRGSSSGLLGSHDLALATSGSHPGARVPLYARASATQAMGFEIKIDGPRAARLIMVRLVIGVRNHPDTFFESRIVMGFRGL